MLTFASEKRRFMRKTLYINICSFAASLLLMLSAASCSSEETYAEQKEKERDAISSFLSRDVKIKDHDGNLLINVGRINTIDEETFAAQGNKTYTESNQYVLFGNSGVYMQIVREGVGERLESGQSKRVLTRYTEFNIMRDSIQSTNDFSSDDSPWADVIDIVNSYGTFTASFVTETYSKMYDTYGSTSVPAGWLIPFSYIRLGRQQSDEQIAKVRLIVPHSQGHSDASNNVYPCFYELKFQEMK